MSKQPAATLSADLVAVKGTAMPVPDMPSRNIAAGRSANATTPSKKASRQISPVKGEGGGMPLNFRVSEAFRREFKVYAAKNGLKLNELLRRSFDAYRREHGK
jgi:hypothetical protein